MKTFLKQRFADLGYYLYRWALYASGHRSRVEPFSTHSPWLTDEAFRTVHRHIASNTLVDQYRCYELWQLLPQVAGIPGAILEIGVWRGGTGALLAARARDCGIDTPVYLCDTFAGVVKAEPGRDGAYEGGEHAVAEDVARALLERLGLTGRVRFLKGIFPDDTATYIKESQLRFVHIDVDVYQSARDILEWAWPRLVPGGMVVYDDYGFAQCEGVTQHVDEQRNRPDRRVIHNLNGHAIVIKLA